MITIGRLLDEDCLVKPLPLVKDGDLVALVQYRIFRMLDLISRGSQGHGPVHLLLHSAAELGFAWDGAEQDGFGFLFLLSG